MKMFFTFKRRCPCGFRSPIQVVVDLPITDAHRDYFKCPECRMMDQDILIILLKLLSGDIRELHFSLSDDYDL